MDVYYNKQVLLKYWRYWRLYKKKNVVFLKRIKKVILKIKKRILIRNFKIIKYNTKIIGSELKYKRKIIKKYLNRWKTYKKMCNIENNKIMKRKKFCFKKWKLYYKYRKRVNEKYISADEYHKFICFNRFIFILRNRVNSKKRIRLLLHKAYSFYNNKLLSKCFKIMNNYRLKV